MSAAGVIVPDWLVNLTALGWRLVADRRPRGRAVAAELRSCGPSRPRSRSPSWSRRCSRRGCSDSGRAAGRGQRPPERSGRRPWRRSPPCWSSSPSPFSRTWAQLVSQIEADVAKLQASLATLQVPAFVGTAVEDVLQASGTVTGAFVAGIVASVAGVVTVMVLATFLVFFFLRDGDKAWMWVFQGLGPQKRERITAAGDDALVRVGGYLRGTTVLSGIIALTDLVFLLVLGVPLAWPLSALVFLSGYIPYFGGIVTTALILIVTVATQGTTAGLILLVLIGIRNMFLGYGVRPTVYGRTVSVHPALVLIALPAGFQLAGVIGLFAAVPVTAVILAVASATAYILEPDPPPPLPGLVPAWLDRTAQWSWRLLVGLRARRARRGGVRRGAPGRDPRRAGPDPRGDGHPRRPRAGPAWAVTRQRGRDHGRRRGARDRGAHRADDRGAGGGGSPGGEPGDRRRHDGRHGGRREPRAAGAGRRRDRRHDRGLGRRHRAVRVLAPGDLGPGRAARLLHAAGRGRALERPADARAPRGRGQDP